MAIALVLFAPAWIFSLAVGLLMLGGSFEFRRLANLPPTAAYLLPALQAAIIAGLYLNWQWVSSQASVILICSAIAWLLMFTRLFKFHENQETGARFQWTSFFTALAAISSCWFALVWLRGQPQGEYLVLLLLILIWAADVGAYFTGKQFGRTKLAPSISPGKTWEGVAGGILLAGLIAVLLSRVMIPADLAVVPLLLLTATTVLTSICGDLLISIHKRAVNLKDAGRLFPGHGGVLDRFDSLLPGACFFALGIRVLFQ
jgi:phosphatidate cytidylyltransferase